MNERRTAHLCRLRPRLGYRRVRGTIYTIYVLEALVRIQGALYF